MSEHEKIEKEDSASIKERNDSTADNSDRENVCLPRLILCLLFFIRPTCHTTFQLNLARIQLMFTDCRTHSKMQMIVQ